MAYITAAAPACALIILSLLTPVVARAADDIPAEWKTSVVYRHPTLRARDYDKIYLQPVILKPQQNETVLTPEQLKILNDAFNDAATSTWANNKAGVTLADQAGPGVLVVQPEVSEFEPVRLKSTGDGQFALRFDGTGRGGNLLMTATDGESGEKILVLREPLRGSKYLVGDQKKRLMTMLDAFRAWGNVLQMRLAEIKRKPATGK